MSDIHSKQTSTLLGDAFNPKRKKRKKKRTREDFIQGLLKKSNRELAGEILDKSNEIDRYKATIKGLRLSLDVKEQGFENMRKKYNEIMKMRYIKY